MAPRSQHPQQARLRKPPGWLRERVLASAPGTHKPARTTWSFLLIFFLWCPLPRLLFYQQLFFQGSGPRGLHNQHPSLRPQGSCRIRILQYCGTFLSLHRHSAHLTKEKSRVRDLFHSERRWFTRNPARNLDSSSSSIRYQKAGYANQWWSNYVCRSGSARKGREGSVCCSCVSIYTSIRTLTRASDPPPRPAQQRPGPDSQPQNQHPR